MTGQQAYEPYTHPGVTPMTDSSLETTRVFWRTKYFDASTEEAHDPRPWAEVWAERKEPTP